MVRYIVFPGINKSISEFDLQNIYLIGYITGPMVEGHGGMDCSYGNKN
jgi:hypothetical protein